MALSGNCKKTVKPPRGRAVALFLALCFLEASSPAAEKPVLNEFMGVNGHTVQFKPALYRPVASHVRDYHPVQWDLGKDSASTPPFPFAANRVSWKHVYGSWLAAGWKIDACLMFESLARPEWKRLPEDTKAYGKAFASAFGPGGVFPCASSAEIGNEPGKFSDEEYRTVFQNMAEGLREGDPKLRIVTCNLTVGKSYDYAKSVSCLEGLEKLYDVLSIHVYAQLEPWPTWKRSHPEDPKLPRYINEVKELCRWRDEHAAGKEVWITEFGYDACTKKPEPRGDFAKWMGNTEEEQALWTVRSWLLFSALPVERAYLYFFNDNDAAQLHGSSGLTRHFVPKPAYWSAAHLQKVLGPYRFHRVVEVSENVMIYEFRQDGKIIWAAWVPTREGKAATISLPERPGTILSAERLCLREGEPEAVPVKDGLLEISGAPVFVRFETAP